MTPGPEHAAAAAEPPVGEPAINPAQLAGAAMALARQHGSDHAGLRRDMLALFRKALQDGRAEARAKLREERDGLRCARRLSHLTDCVVQALHAVYTQHVFPVSNPSTSERLAIVATGGYGRGAMAPGSDVDLLFLTPWKPSPWIESIVEAVLYFLWDLKLKVGHATRSVDECIRESRGDLTIRTSILEARLVCGDPELFDELTARFDREVVEGTAAEFVEGKLNERDARLRQAGAVSRYVVEPNVKEGKGGLRDLNTLFWIGKYVYRVRDARELVRAGLFLRQEYARFAECEEFLWRVRCHMHFIAGRAEERLSFDMQPLVAQELGYTDRGGLSGVERFMKRYFLITKEVGDLTAIVCAAMEAQHAKKRPMLDRFITRLKRPARLRSPDFAIDTDRLTVRSDEAFRNDPVNILRLFWLAQRHNLALHPHARRLVTRSLRLINKAVREDPEANRLFLEILTSPNSPETALRAMNETGALGRFIPEFGRIVAMMQFNMYHHYTVDEHLLRAVGVLSEIDAGLLGDEHPVANRIFPTIQNRRALYVAVFLHDIAKGRPTDHSIAGAAVARRVCPRLGLTRAETELVAWLIEHHLLMSMTAQSRDLADPVTISSFGSVVQTMERLKMLMVLTVADIKAVGPGVWNGWKGELIRTLYYETESYITGGHGDAARSERIRNAQEALRAELPDWDDDAFNAYAARHYPAYWLKVNLERKARHARFIRGSEAAGLSTATMATTDRFRGVTELTVMAPDHPRLLAIIAGSCAAAGANIVDAQIFTTADGTALDTILISREFDEDEDELRRAKRIGDAMVRALKGEVKIGDLVAARGSRSRTRPFKVEPEIVFDNSLSSRETVLEVSGLDRPGLLYDLTTAIAALNLNISSAHIVTFGERAVDTFYVTDLTNAKITGATRQAAIRRQLARVLAPEREEPAGGRRTPVRAAGP
ncbi:[protein-PII] uridylyltransferase [Camelimonas abortus]|uniref:Bifunctional uridylyltransferase/uridylyl-removing enzyme n=1 Tax=Camelimonas abortus TaxID=1017184 RepID=A0ABV7LCG9_9HYPH